MEGIGAGHVQRHRIGVLGQVGDIPPSSPGLRPTPHICYEPGVPLLLSGQNRMPWSSHKLPSSKTLSISDPPRCPICLYLKKCGPGGFPSREGSWVKSLGHHSLLWLRRSKKWGLITGNTTPLEPQHPGLCMAPALKDRKGSTAQKALKSPKA